MNNQYTPPPISRQNNYLFNIDFLRIFYTFCILYRHFFATIGYDNNGWLAVEFFFSLSGFMFLYSWKAEETLSHFLYKKFIRFAPLAAFGAILCAFFQDFNLGKALNALVKPRYVADFLLLNGNGLVGDTAANPPAWYLSAMILLLAVLFLALKTFEKNKVCFFAAIFSYLSFLALHKYGYAPNGGFGGNSDIIPLRLHRGIACVGLGFLGAVFVEKATFVKSKALITFFEIFSLTAAVYFMFKMKTYPTYTFLMCLANTAVICLFVHNKGALSTFLNKPFWKKLSKYMLSLYLTHYAIVYLMQYVLKKYDIPQGKEQLLTALSCVALSVAVAVLAHHLIEKPAYTYLNDLWKRAE
ncbi:MAG: acyltransferase [Alphaproteobacteria bacterium]|nr:acyltransferase [Alphaproteobacteria bacterium]